MYCVVQHPAAVEVSYPDVVDAGGDVIPLAQDPDIVPSRTFRKINKNLLFIQ